MNILSESMVSNSEMIKNYKSCRENAEKFGRIFVIKNNQPDAVLFSITEYKKLSSLIECLEKLEAEDMAKILQTIDTLPLS